MKINTHSIEHLEFNSVLAEIANYAFSEKASQEILQTKPSSNRSEILFLLNSCNEYLSGLQSGNSFPFSAYFAYDQELNRLEIDNFHLETEVFWAIKSNCLQVKQILIHLTNFQNYFPVLCKYAQQIDYKNEIVKEIDSVFNKLGNIKDTASPLLYEIRKKLIKTQNDLSEQFKKALDKNKPYLDDIGESIVENKRVLAIKSMHKRAVKGRFLGTSKTGSISFIEPSNVMQLNRNWEELKDDEQKEIIRILIQLTQTMRQFKPHLISYQLFFDFLDKIQAKAQFCLSINGQLPHLNENRKMILLNAFHPLLLLSNRKNKSTTISQNLALHEAQRMIVISGPNAGGKSITLKTIGLLQLMIQSGILVPVHPKSEFCLFDSIFTDIGDNQSIDNQLSTYSYRLKQMAGFLKKTNENSLLLIDEFGTGSDPQLGGALAEVFLETLYDKKVFGIFTTHYTNIKIRTEELAYATNANMLFDKKTLEPLYKLEIGAAGSSFTFEVAEKNQIPFNLINRAKKKLESETRRLDQTIVKLQQEKFEVFKTQNTLNKQSEENSITNQNLKQTQEKINKKLLDIQLLYDNKSASIILGEKIEKLITHFLYSKQKKQLIAEFLKLTEAESIKKAKLDPKIKEKQKIIEKSVQKELKNSVQKIEIEKEKQKEIEQNQIQKKRDAIHLGTRVKIRGSSSVGTIEKLEKKYALVNYGRFTTKIHINELEVI